MNIITFTGPADYISRSSVELIFEPGTVAERCSNPLIRNDVVVEDDESFRVILSSSDSAVVTTPDTAFVTINNDDSKLDWFLNINPLGDRLRWHQLVRLVRVSLTEPQSQKLLKLL